MPGHDCATATSVQVIVLALLQGKGCISGLSEHVQQHDSETFTSMQGLWDGFEGRGFAAWLPSFYDALLNAASSEARWCASALPDSHPGLLLHLLSALFSRIEKPFRTRLASALVQGMSFLLSCLGLQSARNYPLL